MNLRLAFVDFWEAWIRLQRVSQMLRIVTCRVPRTGVGSSYDVSTSRSVRS